MSDVKWIKLSTHMFDDEKIRLIESMPESDAILVIWIKLLAQAGKTNASGYIYLNENIPYTDEMLATLFNRPLNIIRLALQTFESFGMIELNANDFICISNWEKHQNIEGLDKIREQNRIRKQKEREKKRLSCDSHVTVTQSHATDKELEKENNYSVEFESFWKVYPRKLDKKAAFTKWKTIVKEHNPNDVIEGAKKYAQVVKGTEKQFIKHPKTFLNQESFLNEYEADTQEPVRPSRRKNTAHLEKMAALRGE